AEALAVRPASGRKLSPLIFRAQTNSYGPISELSSCEYCDAQSDLPQGGTGVRGRGTAVFFCACSRGIVRDPLGGEPPGQAARGAIRGATVPSRASGGGAHRCRARLCGGGVGRVREDRDG